MSCLSFMNKRGHNEMLTPVINKLEGKQTYKKMIELPVKEYVQASLDSCGVISNSMPLRKKKMKMIN